MPEPNSVSSFMDSLPPKQAERFRNALQSRKYEAGETIVSHMDSENVAFVVLQGNVQVTVFSDKGKTLIFRNIGEGDIFGELSAIDKQPRSASVIALENCTVGTITPMRLHEMLRAEPDLSWVFLEHLTRQVRAMTTRVIEFDTLRANERLEVELARLADAGKRSGDLILIDPAPTNQELASRISSNREAVSRHMSQLAAKGILRKVAKRFEILQPDKLARPSG